MNLGFYIKKYVRWFADSEGELLTGRAFGRESGTPVFFLFEIIL